VSPAQRKARDEQNQAAIDERNRQQKEYQQAQEDAIRRIKENNPPEPVGDTGLTTETAWTLTLEKLQEQLPIASYATWFPNTVLLGITENTAQVMVPSQFVAEYLNRRHYQGVVRTLSDVIHQDVEVQFIATDAILTSKVGD